MARAVSKSTKVPNVVVDFTSRSSLCNEHSVTMIGACSVHARHAVLWAGPDCVIIIIEIDFINTGVKQMSEYFKT